MKLQRSISCALAGAAALAALSVPPAAACGLHGAMVDIGAAHPQSIGVALAVRDAMDRNLLPGLDPLSPDLAYLRASYKLQRFGPLAAQAAGASGGSVAVLLIESGLWTRYRLLRGGALAEPHVTGPAPGEPAMVTSEAVLSALLDGSIGLDRASELGLVRVSQAEAR